MIGTVKDPQGLAVPGATVLLANRVSQTRQDTLADDVGRFTFANVPYGTYVLTGTLSGFAPAEHIVDVRSTVPLFREVELSVSGIAESVNVASDALLEASSVGSRVALGASLIDQLPTATPSKQIGSVLLSVPGFIPSQNGRIHVRGSHGQIQYVVDGVSMTDEFSEAFANPLDPQYVKSAAVMTGGIPAEYGNKLAAVVDITSRSGLDALRKVSGTATLNAGRFGAVDGGATIGGRHEPNWISRRVFRSLPFRIERCIIREAALPSTIRGDNIGSRLACRLTAIPWRSISACARPAWTSMTQRRHSIRDKAVHPSNSTADGGK